MRWWLAGGLVVTIVLLAGGIYKLSLAGKGFPDIPVFPGAKPSSFVDEEMEGEIKYLYRATWETDKSVPVVMDWYLAAKKKDWKVVTPTFDPKAMGAQDAVFEYGKWRVYMVVQQRDSTDPTYIYVGVNLK